MKRDLIIRALKIIDDYESSYCAIYDNGDIIPLDTMSHFHHGGQTVSHIVEVRELTIESIHINNIYIKRMDATGYKESDVKVLFSFNDNIYTHESGVFTRLDDSPQIYTSSLKYISTICSVDWMCRMRGVDKVKIILIHPFICEKKYIDDIKIHVVFECEGEVNM